MKNELGKITADDLGAIASNRLYRKYYKWMWISLGVLIVWVVLVVLAFAFIDDNNDPEYRVYEIREPITIVKNLPIEQPINDLRLYNDGDIEYMGTRYAPSYVENDEDDYNSLLIIMMIIPFVIWVAGLIYMMYIFEQRKKDFVDANCEIIIKE